MNVSPANNTFDRTQHLPKSRSTDNSKGIAYDCGASVTRRPDIAEHTSRVGHGRGAEKTGEETREEDCLDVFCGGGAEGETGCDEVGC